MYKIVSVALVILIMGGFIFAVEALYGNIKGTGLAFIGICTGVASICLITNVDAIREISSGFNQIEKFITFDTTFTDLKIDGHITGTVS